jgi:hypothetical protein
MAIERALAGAPAMATLKLLMTTSSDDVGTRPDDQLVPSNQFVPGPMNVSGVADATDGTARAAVRTASTQRHFPVRARQYGTAQPG